MSQDAAPLASQALHWRRRAILGWGLLLLVVACAGIKERLERLDAEVVRVSKGKPFTLIEGARLEVVDAEGRRAVLTPEGLTLLEADGKPRAR